MSGSAVTASTTSAVGPRIHSSVFELDDETRYGWRWNVAARASRLITTMGACDAAPGKLTARPTTSTGASVVLSVIVAGTRSPAFARMTGTARPSVRSRRAMRSGRLSGASASSQNAAAAKEEGSTTRRSKGEASPSNVPAASARWTTVNGNGNRVRARATRDDLDRDVAPHEGLRLRVYGGPQGTDESLRRDEDRDREGRRHDEGHPQSRGSREAPRRQPAGRDPPGTVRSGPTGDAHGEDPRPQDPDTEGERERVEEDGRAGFADGADLRDATTRAERAAPRESSGEGERLPGDPGQHARDPTSMLVTRGVRSRRHARHQQDGGQGGKHGAYQRRVARLRADRPVGPEGPDEDDGERGAHARASQDRQDGLDRGARADAGRSPPTHPQHSRLVRTGGVGEHGRGRDRDERDRETGDQQHVRRSAHLRRALIRDPDDAPDRAPIDRIDGAEPGCAHLEPPAAGEERTEAPGMRLHPSLERVGETAEGLHLLDRRLGRGAHGRHERLIDPEVVQLGLQVKELRAVGEDERWRQRTVDTAGRKLVDVLAPRLPVGVARGREDGGVDPVDRHEDGVASVVEHDAIARAEVQWVRDVVGQPDTVALGTGDHPYVREVVVAEEEAAAHGPGGRVLPVRACDEDARAGEALDRRIQLRAARGLLREGARALGEERRAVRVGRAVRARRSPDR